MSKTPNFDAKIKKLLDAIEPGERVCSVTGKKWRLDDYELGWCRRFNTPPTLIEPLARLRMLMAFSSGANLWWNKHVETGESILSYIHPDNPAKIVRDKEWFNIDNTDFGLAHDPGRSLFEELTALYSRVRFQALSDPGNSTNTVGVAPFECTDSFMIFSSLRATRSAYVNSSTHVEDSVDVVGSIGGVSDSYAINHSRSLHNCHFAFESHDCLNCWFIFDCRNCEYCFSATNQRNKKYLWFDKQLLRGEWERKFAEIDLSCHSVIEGHRRNFFDLVNGAAWPENFNVAARDSTGDYLEDTVRVRKGFNLQKATDCFRVIGGVNVENSAYSAHQAFVSDLWCSASNVYSQGLKFCVSNAYSHGLEYCLKCVNCMNCFGCVALYNKKFCVLNKQYSEEEYWRKVDEIKRAMLERGEYGQLFPVKLNLTGANFSAGHLLNNYSNEEIHSWGAEVYDPARGTMYMPEQASGVVPIKSTDLPDCLFESGVIINRPILDEELGRPYVIHPLEHAFYQKHRLPLPRKHFLTRLRDLIRLSNAPVVDKTKCGRCGKEIAHNRNLMFKKKVVLCKECYTKHLESR